MKSNGILAAIVLGGALMAIGCSRAKTDGGSVGLYKTEQGRAAAYRSYDEAMRLWPTDYSEDWVDTDYGKTHVIVAGPKGGKPVFLIPGLFADATMWYANVGPLARTYRVYALDMINYGGKCEPSGKPIAEFEDYAAWFEEITDHYGHDRVAVAGLSYGSAVTLALARAKPERIAAAVLMDPSETFVPMDGGIAWRGVWSFAIFPSRAKYASFFDWMGGGYTDPDMDIWFEHVLDVIDLGSVGINVVPQRGCYKPEELTNAIMPILVLCGGKPILYKDPARFAAAAAEALPNAEIDIVPDTGHGLNMEKPDYVNARMMAFLSKSYR